MLIVGAVFVAEVHQEVSKLRDFKKCASVRVNFFGGHKLA
jgi:hypothetical protein